MLNKIGLSTDPWCTHTLTSKLSLYSPFLLTAVVTPSYKLLLTYTLQSFTPTCLKAHHQPPPRCSPNPPAPHRSSLLLCRYLSPISLPPPPPLLTYPPLHLMAPPLCHSLPCLLLALPHTLILTFIHRCFFLIHYIEATN